MHERSGAGCSRESGQKVLTARRHRCSGTFVSGSWRAACYEPCKQSTKTSKDWALNNQLLPVFGPMPLDRIDRTGVIRWFEGYSARAPGGANSALLVFRQIMNHAIVPGTHRDQPDPGS